MKNSVNVKTERMYRWMKYGFLIGAAALFKYPVPIHSKVVVNGKEFKFLENENNDQDNLKEDSV